MRQDKKEADFVMASGQLLKEEVRYIETAFNRKRTGKKAEESNLLKRRRGKDSENSVASRFCRRKEKRKLWLPSDRQ